MFRLPKLMGVQALPAACVPSPEEPEPRTLIKDKSTLAGHPEGCELRQGDGALPVTGAAPDKRKFLEAVLRKRKSPARQEQTALFPQKFQNWQNLGRFVTEQKQYISEAGTSHCVKTE